MKPDTANFVLATAMTVFCSVLVPTAALAETSAGEIQEYLQSENETLRGLGLFYLSGVGAGLSWSNAFNARNGVEPTFCLPANLGLTGDQHVAIFQGYMNTHPDLGVRPAGVVMLFAMMDAFPCQ